MKNKILLFLCISLLSIYAIAQDATAIWNPTQNPITTYKWTEGANWAMTEGVYPNDIQNAVAEFGKADYPATSECIVDDSVNVFHMKIGNGGDAEAIVRVAKGGSLVTGEWWSGIGWTSPGKLIVERGGMVTFGEHMWIGWEADAVAIIEGTVNVTAMYGSAFEGQPGSGTSYIKNGGVLNLAQLHPDKSFPNASFIDISGGTLKFKGDGVELINTFIADGKIKAYEENAELTVTYNADIDSTIVTAASVVYQVDLNEVTDLTEGGKVWVILGDGSDYEEMKDENGDGIYVASITADRAADLTYKFEYQNGAGENDRASEELSGKDCADANGFRTIAAIPENVLVLPPVLFNSCDVAEEKVQQATTVWTGAKSNLWHIAENWSDGFVPNDNKVVFNVPTAPECLLGVESSIKQFVIGDGGDGGILHVTTGGTLTTTSGWSGIGWSAPGKMIVDAGGTVNFAEHAWIGWESNATVELNGGTINVAGMYGTAFEGQAGTASVYIKEGVLNLAQLHDTKSIPEGSFMDITGGTVNITGDKVAVVNAYIAAERIIAYGGEGTVNISLDTLENTVLTGTAPRQATTVWDPASNPSSTGLWSEEKNWSDKNIPLDNKVVFNKPDATACVLNIESSIKQFVLGDGAAGGTLRVTEGGTLTTTEGWSGVAWTHPATLIVETGGTVNFAGHAWIGWESDATVQLNGGTINVAGMYGTAFEGGAGTASVTINSGILNLAELDETKSIPDGSFMDIKAGTVKITGDKTTVVNAYVTANKIKAYGGNGTVNVTFADGFTTITATAVRKATTVWNPAGNPSTKGLWNDAANWTDGMVPNDNKVVTNVPGAVECVLDTVSTIKQFVLGDGGEGGTVRVANGGTLTTTSGWSGIGWSAPATMIVDEGGTVNFAEHAWIGWESNATLVLNGGTINVKGMFGTAFEGGKGTALVTLKKGVLNLAELHDTKSIPEGSLMNIEFGRVHITGDKVAAVNAYAAAGRITAFGGNGTLSVIFADGVTTILAIPAKGATTVWDPSLNPGSTGLWSDYLNWSDRHVPADNKVVFNVSDAKECVLDVQSNVSYFVIGDGGNGATLKVVNGGTLTTGAHWAGIGWASPGTLIVETGGIVNFGEHAWIGWESDATVEINGGTINVSGMYGTAFEGGKGTATVHVNSGNLNLTGFHPEKSIPNGSMWDIKEGVVTIVGDQTAVVNAYIEAKRITAYGGSGQLFVTFDGTATTIEARDWPVAIDDIDNSEMISRVYPNPTQGVITIENPSNGDFSYAIYTITGKMMINKNNISGSSVQVDMSGLVKGIYMFNVRSAEKTVMHKVIFQ
jgi:hypothetical protein